MREGARTPGRRLSPAEWGPALLVAAVGQQEVWAPLPGFPHPDGWPAWHAAGYLLAATALCWRRRRPLTVLAAITIVEAIQYLVAGAPEGLGTLLPPLVAVFAVGRYATPRALPAVVPMMVLAVALHELRDPQFALDGAAVTYWAILAAAWPVGATLRRHADRAARATSRAADTARVAVSDERGRIARDLHDLVGHAVGVIVLQAVAGTAQLDKGRHDDVRQRLASIELTARQALTEMRRLVDVLDSGEDGAGAPADAADADLPSLLRRMADSGLPVHYEVVGPPRPVPPAVALTAYRVVQEALTNTLKHAGPVPVSVTVTHLDDAMEVRVVDTGTGTPAVPAQRGGRGLLGMQERLAIYGGSLSAGADADGGFRVLARIPTQQAPA
jgi:signal transduction histidine kinase